ncbi:hypothetical protein J2Y74_000853 [Pseudomonas migulae]|nr:hypothetical protein [Pseudomonas migulae]
MRTIQESRKHYVGNVSADADADDETTYLLNSKANAKRLLRSITSLRSANIKTATPDPETGTPILLELPQAGQLRQV